MTKQTNISATTAYTVDLRIKECDGDYYWGQSDDSNSQVWVKISPLLYKALHDANLEKIKEEKQKRGSVYVCY